MAANTQKFTTDEMKKLSDLQKGYQDVTVNFGRVKVQKVILNQQLEAMDNESERLEKTYSDLQKSEQELVTSLNDKYGAGSLDIQSGEFTPSPEGTSQGPAATPNS